MSQINVIDAFSTLKIKKKEQAFVKILYTSLCKRSYMKFQNQSQVLLRKLTVKMTSMLWFLLISHGNYSR